MSVESRILSGLGTRVCPFRTNRHSSVGLQHDVQVFITKYEDSHEALSPNGGCTLYLASSCGTGRYVFASIEIAVSSRSSISTRKHLEYTKGYIGLGMIKEASAELEAIEAEDGVSLEVQRVRVDLFMEAKQWEQVVDLTGQIAENLHEDEQVWISWAYALRELQRIKEAREVLLKAEKVYGHKSAILHYNLACYASLLHYLEEANKRLKRAIKLDKRFEDECDKDPDLKALFDVF
jgi:tetratricopeptide (TPR) repeat protein